MQAVGTALTGGHGGLGIAAMVAKQLEARASHPTDPGKPLTIKDLKAEPITIKPLVSPQVAK
jgi:hypothetical protein